MAEFVVLILVPVAVFLGVAIGTVDSVAIGKIDSGKQFKAGDAIYQCSVINKLEVK